MASTLPPAILIDFHCLTGARAGCESQLESRIANWNPAVTVQVSQGPARGPGDAVIELVTCSTTHCSSLFLYPTMAAGPVATA